MAVVDLIGQLIAGKGYLFGIDDNNEVAGVDAGA